ncbi:MAG: class I SAM-dependent methyltransferase [Planctomycetes bacterium]|nr:class I SAM-dependent methyltransferase [Planctomycetota bacterium]
MRTELGQRARELGLELDEAAWGRVAQLEDLWLRYGAVANLVGAKDRVALQQHLEDGLATVACAAKTLSLGPEIRWLDVGSGGGLPGLLVVAVTECDCTLVEPRQKRAAFLEFALGMMGRRARVCRARLGVSTWSENGAEQVLDRENMGFCVATARAVFAPERWRDIAESCVKSGGVWIAHHVRGGATAEMGEFLGKVQTGSGEICAYRVR